MFDNVDPAGRTLLIGCVGIACRSLSAIVKSRFPLRANLCYFPRPRRNACGIGGRNRFGAFAPVTLLTLFLIDDRSPDW
ncbi:MAG: hypothetical protein KDA75_12455, partial [Planctomycetaceae bacterium]|nr:hypothetical protein [Planctomycetaceae bacterium]